MSRDHAESAFGGCFCWNGRLDIRLCEFRADGVGVIALIGEKRLDPVGQHPEQRSTAFHVVSLSGRQDEAQRSALTIAAGVQLGRQAASRTTKPLSLLIPFFSPPAQWSARTTVLSIMSAVVSRSTTAASVSSMTSNTPVTTRWR